MNKNDIIKKVADSSNVSLSVAGVAVNTVLSSISEAMAAGDTVTLIGFGTFKTKERSARTARNPSTGAELKVPAKTVPSFTAGKLLKDAVAK